MAGVGIAVYDIQTMKEVYCGWKFLGKKYSNNVAEYTALICSLERAHNLGIQKLVAEGDSALVVNQVNGKYRTINTDLQQQLERVKKALQRFQQQPVHVRHIPRQENQRADFLANMAMDGRDEWFSDYQIVPPNNNNNKIHSVLDNNSAQPFSNKRMEAFATMSTTTNAEDAMEPSPSQLAEEQETQRSNELKDLNFSCDKKYVLSFGGASKGQSCPAGCAVVLHDEQTMTELWSTTQTLVESTITLNQAFYHGVLLGLECAKELGLQHIVLRGSSELVLRQLKKAHKVKSPMLKPLFDACQEEINSGAFDSVEYAFAPIEENRQVSKLAKQAIKPYTRHIRYRSKPRGNDAT